MTAETISYDMNTKKITAEGNVTLKNAGSTISGNSGVENAATREFAIKGGVRGKFTEKKAELTSDSINYKAGKTSGGIVEANGNVRINMAGGDYLRAQYARWETNSDNYMARGGVDMRHEGRILKASEAGVTATTFWGRDVTRYEDMKQKIVIAAATVDGKVRNRVVQEVTAVGNVKIEYLDKDGLKTVITSSKGVYTKSEGTFILSGGAKAVRSDGKTVSADTIILHEQSKNIEARGNSRITFTLSDKKDKPGESKSK